MPFSAVASREKERRPIQQISSAIRAMVGTCLGELLYRSDSFLRDSLSTLARTMQHIARAVGLDDRPLTGREDRRCRRACRERPRQRLQPGWAKTRGRRCVAKQDGGGPRCRSSRISSIFASTSMKTSRASATSSRPPRSSRLRRSPFVTRRQQPTKLSSTSEKRPHAARPVHVRSTLDMEDS